jgi:hypothetical protein
MSPLPPVAAWLTLLFSRNSHHRPRVLLQSVNTSTHIPVIPFIVSIVRDINIGTTTPTTDPIILRVLHHLFLQPNAAMVEFILTTTTLEHNSIALMINCFATDTCYSMQNYWHVAK